MHGLLREKKSSRILATTKHGPGLRSSTIHREVMMVQKIICLRSDFSDDLIDDCDVIRGWPSVRLINFFSTVYLVEGQLQDIESMCLNLRSECRIEDNRTDWKTLSGVS